MAARFLLDTNICIYIRRYRPPQVLARFDSLKAGDAALSVVTYGELSFGAEKGPTPADAFNVLSELVSRLSVLPLPAEAGKWYGIMRAHLERNGEMIGANDIWIAAHTKSAGLTLVTNNEREFKRIPGLNVENWVK